MKYNLLMPLTIVKYQVFLKFKYILKNLNELKKICILEKMDSKKGSPKVYFENLKNK